MQCDLRRSLAEFPSLERDLPRELASILRKKVKKITVVDPDKVAHLGRSPPALDRSGRRGAGLQCRHRHLSRSRAVSDPVPGDLNMVHGESKVHIQVFEMQYPKNSKDKPIKDQPKEAHNIYDEYAESSFPNRGPLPIDTGTAERAFKNTFLRIVVKEVSWHFVEHAEDDSIQDSRIEK